MNAGVSIDWTPHRALYDEIQFDVATPLEQAWNYGEAISAVSRNRIRRAVIEIDGLPAATLQVAERPLPLGLTAVRLTRGPSVSDPAHIDTVLRALCAEWPVRRGRLLFLMPDLPEDDAHRFLGATRKRRMTTGYTTAWLDLAPEPDDLMAAMRANWRGALNKGQAEAPVIRVTWRRPDIEEFLGGYGRDRRARRYRGPSPRLVRSMSDAFGRDLRLYRAHEHGDTVAASLFVTHGRSATYFLSWTTERGRALNAAHVLLWEAVCAFRDAGIRWLDLGGIDAHAPGVARFKLGLGAPPVTFSGTWL